MYSALHRADDIGTAAPDSRGHSPSTCLVHPYRNTLAGPVGGVWRSKDKSAFDNASLTIVYRCKFHVVSLTWYSQKLLT